MVDISINKELSKDIFTTTKAENSRKSYTDLPLDNVRDFFVDIFPHSPDLVELAINKFTEMLPSIIMLVEANSNPFVVTSPLLRAPIICDSEATYNQVSTRLLANFLCNLDGLFAWTDKRTGEVVLATYLTTTLDQAREMLDNGTCSFPESSENEVVTSEHISKHSLKHLDICGIRTLIELKEPRILPTNGGSFNPLAGVVYKKGAQVTNCLKMDMKQTLQRGRATTDKSLAIRYGYNQKGTTALIDEILKEEYLNSSTNHRAESDLEKPTIKKAFEDLELTNEDLIFQKELFLQAKVPTTTTVVRADEISLVGRKFVTIFSDYHSGEVIFMTLTNRKAVITLFKEFMGEYFSNIEYFVIDMNGGFKGALKELNVPVIHDKFHVINHCNEYVTSTLKIIMKANQNAQYKKLLNHDDVIGWLLSKPAERLNRYNSDSSLKSMIDTFNQNVPSFTHLAKCVELLHKALEQQPIEDSVQALNDFVEKCKNLKRLSFSEFDNYKLCGIDKQEILSAKEIEDANKPIYLRPAQKDIPKSQQRQIPIGHIMRIVERNIPELSRAAETGMTTGPQEGDNHLFKVFKRMRYGHKNLMRFFLRIKLFASQVYERTPTVFSRELIN